MNWRKINSTKAVMTRKQQQNYLWKASKNSNECRKRMPINIDVNLTKARGISVKSYFLIEPGLPSSYDLGLFL